jgi:hypothetical protein
MGKRRGHIEEVGGKYRGVASAGRDPVTGRRRQPKTELFATAAEAEAELLELHRQIDEDRQPKSKITVNALIEKWFDVAQLEDSTRERYEGLNRKYIEPAFGSIQFAKLDPEHLESSTRGCASAGISATSGAQRTTSAHRWHRAAFDRSTPCLRAPASAECAGSTSE